MLLVHLANDGHRHGLIVQLTDTGPTVRRDFTIGVETEPRHAITQFDAGGLHFLHRALTHQKPAAYATYQDSNAITFIEPASGLFGSVGSAGGETIEIAAHVLGYPAFGHIASKGHRICLVIDSKDGAHKLVFRVLRIVDAYWKQQGSTGQAIGLIAE